MTVGAGLLAWAAMIVAGLLLIGIDAIAERRRSRRR